MNVMSPMTNGLPSNQYKRAQQTTTVTTVNTLRPQIAGENQISISSSSPAKNSVTTNKLYQKGGANPPLAAQQRQLNERLAVPGARKQRGSGVTQSGLRQSDKGAGGIAIKAPNTVNTAQRPVVRK